MDYLSIVVYVTVAVVACLFVRQAIGRVNIARFLPDRGKETDYRLEKTS